MAFSLRCYQQSIYAVIVPFDRRILISSSTRRTKCSFSVSTTVSYLQMLSPDCIMISAIHHGCWWFGGANSAHISTITYIGLLTIWIFGVRYKQVIAAVMGMRCRKCGNYKTQVVQELMDRLMGGENLTTEELMALQTVGDPCSCTQIYRFLPFAINWSSSNPRWW